MDQKPRSVIIRGSIMKHRNPIVNVILIVIIIIIIIMLKNSTYRQNHKA